MKTKLKFLLMAIVILGAICIFGANKVKASCEAAVTEGTPTANSLDNIADTINLNIKESECEKVPQLIMNKIITEFKGQGIKLNTEDGFYPEATIVSVWFGSSEDEDIFTSYDCLYDSSIYKVAIRVKAGDGTRIINRDLNIKYNNTANYNNADKEYVENLMKKFQSENPPYWINMNIYGDIGMTEALYKKINDASITLVPDGRMAGDVDFGEGGYCVFKDGVLYQNIQVRANYYQLTSNVDIGHNMTVDGLLEDVTITVTPKENEDMRLEVSNLGYAKILGEYELTLTGAEKLAHPIDITFNVGAQYNGKKACVLHKKKDGTFEKFEERVLDGKIKINVSELSPFVIAINETNDYILGDIDGNGKIDAGDAVMILKHVAHNITLTEKELLAADTNKDGTVNAGDATRILKYVAHNITEF